MGKSDHRGNRKSFARGGNTPKAEMIAAWVDSGVYERVKAKAAKEDRSMSSILRQALERVV